MADLPGDTRDRAPVRRLTWLYFAACLLVCALYPLCQLYAYADGGLFSFMLLSGHSFSLIWSAFPGRLAVYALTILPSEQLLRATHDPHLALHLYGLLFGGLPLLGAVTAVLVLPAGKRREMMWPASMFLVFGLMTFGFPTEVWLTGALFWPLLFAVRYFQPSLWRCLGLLALGLAYCFSHEGMVLGLPVLALAAFFRLREPDGRRAAAGLLAVLLLPLLTYIAVRAGWTLHNRALARALRGNAADMLPWKHPGNYFIVLKIAVIAASSAWLYRVTQGAASGAWRAALFLLALVLGPLGPVDTFGHYATRLVVLVAGPALGCVWLLAPRAPRLRASFCPPWTAQMLCATAVPAIFLLHAASFWPFEAHWQQMRAAILESTETNRVPLATKYMALFPNDDGRSRGVLPMQVAFDWRWPLPYQSVVLQPDLAPKHLLITPADIFLPVHCAALRAGFAQSMALGWFPDRLFTRFDCVLSD